MEPLFSLFAEDDDNFRDFCASTREYATEFSPEDLKVESIITEISHLNWEKIGKTIASLLNLNFHVECNIHFEDPVTDLQKINDYILKLPITTLLLLRNEDCFLSPYRFLNENTPSGTLDEFDERVREQGGQLTQEEVELLFDQTKELESVLGIQICKAVAVMDEDDDIPHWNCNSINCTREGDDIASFIEHYSENHNDNLSGLKIIWADTIRWIREKGTVPTVEELLKPIFMGILTLNEGHSSVDHMFFNKKKFDTSLATAIKWENEVDGASMNYVANTGKILIDVIEGGILQDVLNTVLPPDSLSAYTFEHLSFPATQIEEQYDPDYVFIENSDTQQTSSDITNEHDQVNEENYQEFKLFIKDSIKELTKPEEINNFILEELNVEFEEELKQRIIESTEEPIICTFLAKYNWIPKAGLASMIPGDNQIFNTSQKQIGAVREHYKLHKEQIDRNSAYYFPIIGEGRWRNKVNNEEKPRLENPPYKCCFYDCGYHCSNEKQRFEHQKNGTHIQARERTPDVGPFWMALIDYTITHDDLPTINTLLRPRTSFVCDICGSGFSEINAIAQHLYKKHKVTNSRTTGQHILEASITWVTKETDTQLINEANQERIRSLARPIITNATQQHQGSDVQNQGNDSQNRAQAPQVTSDQQQPNIDPQQANAPQAVDPQIHNDLNENLELLDANINVENAALINTARDWILRFSQEEDMAIGIPTLTVERRKLVKKDLKTLYTTIIIPLLEKFMPLNDTEEEKLKLDGVILKIAHELRNHCKNKLGLTNNNITRNARSTTERTSQDLEEKNTLSLSSDSAYTIKYLRQMKALSSVQEQSQSMVNKFEKLKDKVFTIMHNRNEEWNTQVFGGNSKQNIIDTINLDQQQFERRLDWLKSVVDNSASKVTKATMKIRNMYEDSPRKCLNRYIWPKTTPECPLTHEDFERHYGAEWATEVINYSNPTETDEFNIDRTITDGSDTRFNDHMLSEKRIKQIIASRNYISAHGRDGLSNALYRLAKDEATTMFKLIFKAIITTKHVPRSWTRTKTIMLYKKNDPNHPSNWRPIGITSTMYRIMTAQISAFINIENKKNDVFHPSQRGFIGGKGNGAHDHINSLNELILHARRNESKCVLTAIDLTNAFGSVPHKLIFDTLEQKGFGNTFMSIIKDLYSNSETTIEVKGQRSEAIRIKRGVIQGCPLSPLLFNCCIDPLLTHLERFNAEDGITLEYNNGPFSLTAQAYADDLVLISKDENAAANMINSLVTYCNGTSLIIAPKKCISIVEGFQELPTISIEGHNLSVIKSGSTIKYLGAPITGNKSTKFAEAEVLIDDAKNKTKLIFNSQLSLSQKIHAVKCFILPKLDYILTNSNCKVASLAKLDSFIRGMIMKGAETQRIPKEFAHIPSKEGGLGIPNLKTKGDTLKIINFVNGVLSPNRKIADMSAIFAMEEVEKRGIVKGDDNRFFDWAFEGDTNNAVMQSHSNNGTSCAIIMAMHACISNNIHMYVEDQNKLMVSHNGTSKRITSAKSAKDALNGFFLENLLNGIKRNIVHGHSFTGPIMKESHIFRNTVPINDSIFKFTIKGRTNTLPTEGNIHDWTGKGNGICKHCNNGKETLHHLLNNCHSKMQFYTYRHNIVANILRDAIRTRINPEYYKESCQISLNELTDGAINEGISNNNTHLRPDIFYLDSDNVLTIIEIGIAYNQERNRDEVITNTLEDKHAEKKSKYASLVQEIKNSSNLEVKYYTIIASSLGHITSETLTNLKAIFGPKKGSKIAEEIATKVIMCSKCIYNNISPAIYGLPTSTWPGRLDTHANISDSTEDGVSSESNADSIDEDSQNTQDGNFQNNNTQNARNPLPAPPPVPTSIPTSPLETTPAMGSEATPDQDQDMTQTPPPTPPSDPPDNLTPDSQNLNQPTEQQ